MRLLTIVSILLLSLVTGVWGIGATEFAVSRAAVAVGMTASLNSWVGFPGVTVEALDVSLRDALTATADTKASLLMASLAVRPLSAQGWLSLAGVRLALGRPMSEVNDALAMSWIVGPNEGIVMWRRGMFGALIWEVLTPGGRRQTIADIAGSLIDDAATDPDMQSGKILLSKKSDEVRAAISRALQGAGVSSDRIKEIGLQADAG